MVHDWNKISFARQWKRQNSHRMPFCSNNGHFSPPPAPIKLCERAFSWSILCKKGKAFQNILHENAVPTPFCGDIFWEMKAIHLSYLEHHFFRCIKTDYDIIFTFTRSHLILQYGIEKGMLRARIEHPRSGSTISPTVLIPPSRNLDKASAWCINMQRANCNK